MATALAPAPAYAGVAGFAVVNAAGADISALSIRQVGKQQWAPLSVVAALGQSTPVTFAHDDCAFDLRATLATGATITWSGVNLCDVKRVTLHRNAAGLVWVDYD